MDVIERIKNREYEIAAELLFKQRMGTMIHTLKQQEMDRLIREISSRLGINHNKLWNSKKETEALIDIAEEAYSTTCDELESDGLIPPMDNDIKKFLNDIRGINREDK